MRKEKQRMTVDNMPEMLTVKQLANYLQVCPGTIYKLLEEGELKSVNIRGNMKRIPRNQAIDYFCLQ